MKKIILIVSLLSIGFLCTNYSYAQVKNVVTLSPITVYSGGPACANFVDYVDDVYREEYEYDTFYIEKGVGGGCNQMEIRYVMASDPSTEYVQPYVPYKQP
jgi:hypothetical protein